MIIINGKPNDSISALDRGLAYGDGVFETMLVDNERIALWQYHCDRLVSGLSRLGMDVDILRLENNLRIALQRSNSKGSDRGKGVLKLMVTRGSGGHGYSPLIKPKPNIITIYYPSIFQKEKDEMKSSQGISVHCCQQTLPVSLSTAGLKLLNQLHYVLACQERLDSNVDEGLLFTDAGYLIEATARNIFIIKDGELLTPLLNQCGVAGVMQRLLVEVVAPEAALVVRQLLLTKEDLFNAEEVFLSNSVTGIWPVISCGNKQWAVGSVTQKLQYGVYEFLKQNTHFQYPY
ncbi:aminodeoxychorismate lyase [Candidatus Endobugula sertula]|uniref:Aminodeoxychorismate lyase n=1 Tax=Candidatus Endobugula sertula TaxID=62101 RepID=A0A1D2QUA3_9GAMM|nr:aminodeoxychorismate lyase [Candidatus Endobugula sertula]